MEKGLKIVTIGGGSSYTPELIEYSTVAEPPNP